MSQQRANFIQPNPAAEPARRGELTECVRMQPPLIGQVALGVRRGATFPRDKRPVLLYQPWAQAGPAPVRPQTRRRGQTLLGNQLEEDGW